MTFFIPGDAICCEVTLCDVTSSFLLISQLNVFPFFDFHLFVSLFLAGFFQVVYSGVLLFYLCDKVCLLIGVFKSPCKFIDQAELMKIYCFVICFRFVLSVSFSLLSAFVWVAHWHSILSSLAASLSRVCQCSVFIPITVRLLVAGRSPVVRGLKAALPSRLLCYSVQVLLLHVVDLTVQYAYFCFK